MAMRIGFFAGFFVGDVILVAGMYTGFQVFQPLDCLK